MPQDGVHTKGQGPWHNCGRCGRKAKLRSELVWQRQVLICNDCKDDRLVGTYEASVASVMATLIDSPDLMPDPKLTNPELEAFNEDILF